MIYRSVGITIQNNAPCALVVAGGEMMQGEWVPSAPLVSRDGLVLGAVVAPQSASALQCRSSVLGTGCEAFVRLSSTMGILHLRWARPWVGPFRFAHDFDTATWTGELVVHDETPASPTALLILSLQAKGT